MKELGLYIHIPFCKRKCFYCDFISFPDRHDIIEKYVNCLINELSLYRDRLKDCVIRTIFIGGGTPSAIEGKYIRKILEYIYENFNVSNLLETTIEVNPGTLTLEKVQIYKEVGINRVSLGLQTTNDEMLKKIGRIHRIDDFYRSYNILREFGFNNINVDLIFGLPDQTLEDVIEDLDIVTNLDIDHISYYSLIVEPGTIMYKWNEEGRLHLPDEEVERQMYHRGIEFLRDRGYIHYEISNFAKKGYECLHNMIYWRVEPYIGIGLASHSNFNNKRFWNVDNLDRYISSIEEGMLPISSEEIINKNMEMAEYCILGLRLIDGINRLEFEKRFHVDILDIYENEISKHIEDGLLKEEKQSIILTDKGLDLANLVEMDFLP
ncbi:MAG: radical SAM family heme chaperone HemW [Tissierellaceae bacterium]